MRKTKLRFTGRQYAALQKHLYPGDGKEAAAIALCGVGICTEGEDISIAVCVNRIIPIPYEDCECRTETEVKWHTEILLKLIKEAERKGQVFLKIHSHPTDIEYFSEFDNESDSSLFMGISGWLDTDFPGISAIMLPDGLIKARTVNSHGNFDIVDVVSIAGHDIKFWFKDSKSVSGVPEYAIRTAQTFGQGTTNLLSKLNIGVVGVSGTGSPTIEMLYRLGVGKLILVDADIVEEKNVGRIINSSISDAVEGKYKVDITAEAIMRSGLPVKVVPIAHDTFDHEVVRQLSLCDILFGCVDSIDGRDLLNRIATFYNVPYFDLGVKLEADGYGGVDQVCGSVNYLLPDGSSLLSRGIYTAEDLRVSSLRRTNPEEYKNQIVEKYIKGVREDRPAVISVNMLISSLGINEMLARVHPFRDDSNEEIGSICVSLTQSRFIVDEEGPTCMVLSKYTGRGDMVPLLDMPALSEMR